MGACPGLSFVLQRGWILPWHPETHAHRSTSGDAAYVFSDIMILFILIAAIVHCNERGPVEIRRGSGALLTVSILSCRS